MEQVNTTPVEEASGRKRAYLIAGLLGFIGLAQFVFYVFTKTNISLFRFPLVWFVTFLAFGLFIVILEGGRKVTVSQVTKEKAIQKWLLFFSVISFLTLLYVIYEFNQYKGGEGWEQLGYFLLGFLLLISIQVISLWFAFWFLRLKYGFQKTPLIFFAFVVPAILIFITVYWH